MDSKNYVERQAVRSIALCMSLVIGVMSAYAQSPSVTVESLNRGLSIPATKPFTPRAGVLTVPAINTGSRNGDETSSSFEVRSVKVEWKEKPPENAELIERQASSIQGRFTISELKAKFNDLLVDLRARGYLAALAWIPPQVIQDGVVIVGVSLGKVTSVTAMRKNLEAGEVSAVDSVTAVLCEAGEDKSCASLPLDRNAVERALLLAGERTNSRVQGRLNLGALERGTELELEQIRLQSPDFSLGVDNFGGQKTDRTRLHLQGSLRGVVDGGDVLSFAGVGSPSGDSSNVQVEYSYPLGLKGWRVGLTAARTSYFLSGDFSALGAHGSMDSYGIFATYPLLKTLEHSVEARVAIEQSFANDYLLDFNTRHEQDGARIALQGQHFDSVWGLSGATNWNAALVQSHVESIQTLTAEAAAPDATRLVVRAERSQSLGNGFSVNAVLIAQGADGNLHSFNKLYLGGAEGVRAYPIGEAGGDSATIGRLQFGWMGPLPGSLSSDWRIGWALFHDSGWASVSQHPLSGTRDNIQIRAGSGVEFSLLRQDKFFVRVFAAQAETGVSTVDKDSARVGMSATIKF